MDNYAYKVDKNGFIIESYLIRGDIPVPEDSITVQLPQPNFHNPKWSGTKWTEGATQEEIDELTKIKPSPPTERELLKQRLTITENALVDLILGGM